MVLPRVWNEEMGIVRLVSMTPHRLFRIVIDLRLRLVHCSCAVLYAGSVRRLERVAINNVPIFDATSAHSVGLLLRRGNAGCVAISRRNQDVTVPAWDQPTQVVDELTSRRRFVVEYVMSTAFQFPTLSITSTQPRWPSGRVYE